MWFPCNPVLRRAGTDDTIEDALTYYHAVVGDRTPRELQETYVRRGGDLIEYLESDEHFAFEMLPWPDYFGKAPKARLDGQRHIMPTPLPHVRAGRAARAASRTARYRPAGRTAAGHADRRSGAHRAVPAGAVVVSGCAAVPEHAAGGAGGRGRHRGRRDHRTRRQAVRDPGPQGCGARGGRLRAERRAAQALRRTRRGPRHHGPVGQSR